MDRLLQKTNLNKLLGNFSCTKDPRKDKKIINHNMTNLPEIVITTAENENILIFDEKMFELFQGNIKVTECLKLIGENFQGERK